MLDLAQDGSRRCCPDERARVLVMFAHIRPNRGDEGRNAAEGATPNPLARDLGEETLDQVQPRSSSWGEVKVKPRVLSHPRLHSRMLMRAVVVQDQMNVPFTRCLAIDLVQEGEEFGVRVTGLAGFDDMPLQDVEGRE